MIKEINFKVKFECEDNEVKEVKERLTKLIQGNISRLEGLLTDGLNPFKKSYYFTIKKVEVK